MPKNKDPKALIAQACRTIQGQTEIAPRLGIVLGSGLGALAERIENTQRISYDQLAGFPRPGVSGHAGMLHLGTLAGLPVACLQGRAHVYEGHAAAMAVPIRVLRQLGCRAVYLSCAAGSLNQKIPPGHLMTITDHLNMMGTSPLVGANDDAIGPRFPSLADAYDPDLTALQKSCLPTLQQGIYAAWLGPAFETPAEVRMLRILGADAVGMSVVPEVLLARHCGLKVTATAGITNYGVGMSDDPVTHEQTLTVAAQLSDRFCQLVSDFAAAFARKSVN
ncbi:MAG: purine-nucleoside phosphorylase [Pseudomonadota bacterium]